jgi:hypothetical protein
MKNKETLKEADYTYIKSLGNGEHILSRNEDNKLEIWANNKNHASYGIIFKNTHLEFCRSLSLTNYLY